MSLKVLPVDVLWVDRMVTLARTPWDRAMVEAMFVEWGLARPDETVEWEGGPGAPQFAVDADGQPSGWSVELGAAPPDPGIWVHLPCALYWPAFGAEEPENTDDEDEYHEDMPPMWIRRPNASRGEFHAERDRLAALITARLGAPEIVVTGCLTPTGRCGDVVTGRCCWRRPMTSTRTRITTYSASGCNATTCRSPTWAPDRRPRPGLNRGPDRGMSARHRSGLPLVKWK